MHYRNEHHTWYPSPEGLTPWYCQLVVRNGLWSIASFMIQLISESTDLAARSDIYIYSHLEVLTDVLLETYTGAVTAKNERGYEHKGLLDEYWRRRDALLESLYQLIKGFAEARYQDLNEGVKEPIEIILRELSSPLLSIAKRHESYISMWNICCDLDDSVLLRNLMHESMGPKGGFSYFVFNKLYENRQFGRLLRIGEEFQEELAVFLKQHTDLLWLHEMFLNHFASASETLHALALSQNDSVLSSEEGLNPDNTNLEPSLADRKRLLNLSKIAAIAGRDPEFEMTVKRIEADLKILKLQEEILRLLPDNEEKKVGHQLLPPAELIELCLKGQSPELSLRAFDIFAWTSSSFRKSNRSLLEECWRNAANQDNWRKLYEISTVEGWSDEETLQALRQTVIFQASNRCYGPKAETYEGGFDKVLPLRQGDKEEFLNQKETGLTVEGILMQHKNFPEAGKLIVTAIMLGKVGDEMRTEEGPIPMD